MLDKVFLLPVYYDKLLELGADMSHFQRIDIIPIDKKIVPYLENKQERDKFFKGYKRKSYFSK